MYKPKKDRGNLRAHYLKVLDITDEAQMKDWYTKFYPMGSGPLGAMGVICSLLEILGTEQGFDVSKW